MRHFRFGKIVIFVLLFFAAISALLMVLWNWLLPELFGFPTITFWKAAGLLLLAKIIFGFGFKGAHHHHGGSSWKQHWKEKWNNLPEEQREKWKQRFKDKWGCCGEPYEKIREKGSD